MVHIQKRSIRFVVLSLFCVSTVFAQEPAGYYNGASGKSGAQLKTALYSIVSTHTQRTYGDLWTDFQSTDMRSDGKVWDMYSNCNFTWGKGPGGNQDQGSGGNAECQFYNREHSFPNSWFGGDKGSPMYTDLYHMIPSDKYVNNRRGNMAYGVVGTASQTFGNGSKIGSCTYPNCNGTVFEPIDEYKGDFARAYLYMVTSYENVVANWYSNTEARQMLNGTSYPAFQSWAVSMLLDWHHKDTVSVKERNRNNAVYAIQGNRNPFIDHPELAEYVWGDSIGRPWGGGGATFIAQVKQCVDFDICPNPVHTQVNIRMADGVLLQKVEIFDMAGVLLQVQVGDSRELSLQRLNAGVYILRATTDKGVGTQKFMVEK